jgi:hypothetical protein
MSQYHFSREELKNAFLAFDLAEVNRVLSDTVAPDEEHAKASFKVFKRCGCAVVRQHNKKAMTARDVVATRLRSYLTTIPEQAAALDAHLQDARLVEESFHDVLATLETFEISRRPPRERSWACIKLATYELNEGVRVHEEQQQAREGFVMLKHPSIAAEGGRTISLDSVVYSLTRGLGQNLQMLAYREKWFDAATGDIVIPPPVEVDDSTVESAGLLFVMELAWTDLMTGWDRVRLFDGTVKRGPRTLKFDNHPEPVEVDLLEFGPPTKWELYDAVAVNRLNHNLFQHLKDITIHAQGETITQSLEAGPVALPGPGSFTSSDELIAYHFFEEVLFLPVSEDAPHAGGLSLKQWLRGYAFLAELCRRDGKPVVDARILTKDEIVAGLSRGGFTEADAEKFVGYATFGKGSRDLMDNPLVRMADGRFMMFAPGFRSPVLTTIVMSRLSAFQPDFADKGQRFESAVCKQFSAVGVPAKTFKYKIDGTQYDCDVAALWGRTLFVFECKNHGLAFGHLPSLRDFHKEFWHAAEQAVRTKEFLEKNPDVVREQFGANAKWKRVVACVLYATPWCIGPIVKGHDLYSYDASALGKFLREGRVSLESPRKHQNMTVLRRHHQRLWKGKKPKDDDLLRQLNDPMQLKMEQASRKIEGLVRETAQRKCEVLPSWYFTPATPEQTLAAMGIPKSQVAKIVQSFAEFHAAADAFDLRLASKSKSGAEPIKPNAPDFPPKSI